MLSQKWLKTAWMLILTGLFMLTDHASGQQLLPGQSRLFDTTGGYVTEIPFANDENKGEVYLWEDWKTGRINLSNGQSIEGYEFKYALDKNQFEIKSKKGVKILHGERVADFYLEDKNKRNFKSVSLIATEEYANGFMEVLFEGQISVYAVHTVEIVRPNYVPQFDAGSTQSKYNQKTRYYLANGKETLALKKGMKKNFNYFSPYSREVKDYIIENGLKFNNDYDVMQIAGYFNDLITNNE